MRFPWPAIPHRPRRSIRRMGWALCAISGTIPRAARYLPIRSG